MCSPFHFLLNLSKPILPTLHPPKIISQPVGGIRILSFTWMARVFESLRVLPWGFETSLPLLLHSLSKLRTVSSNSSNLRYCQRHKTNTNAVSSNLISAEQNCFLLTYFINIKPSKINKLDKLFFCVNPISWFLYWRGHMQLV